MIESQHFSIEGQRMRSYADKPAGAILELLEETENDFW